MVKRQRRSDDNPLVFLEVAVGGERLGQIIIELFKDVVPKVPCHCIVIVMTIPTDLRSVAADSHFQTYVSAERMSIQVNANLKMMGFADG